MPCLNEEETVWICIKKALKFLNTNNIKVEVLIVGNNSTNNSSKLAKELGDRVILEKNKGCVNSLRRGFKETYGKYVIFGDCDDSYDFLNLELFLDNLREGYSLVKGNWFKGGVKCAMSLFHKVEVRFLSYLGRLAYKSASLWFSLWIKRSNKR